MTALKRLLTLRSDALFLRPMSIVLQVKKAAATAIRVLYQLDITDQDILVNATKPEFEGDYTVVLFGLVKQLKKSPDALGEELGKQLLEQNPELFSAYNIIKGFLNLTVTENYWVSFLQQEYTNQQYGHQPATGKKVMVEY